MPAQLLDPKSLAPGLGPLIQEMVKRYKAETKADAVPPHVSMGFNQTWIFLTDVLPRAIKKYGGADPEALRKAALDTDIPDGGTIQGYGVKFHRPGDEMSGQNERSSPVVMQYINGKTEVVWPARLRTAEPVLPWPKSTQLLEPVSVSRARAQRTRHAGGAGTHEGLRRLHRREPGVLRSRHRARSSA